MSSQPRQLLPHSFRAPRAAQRPGGRHFEAEEAVDLTPDGHPNKPRRLNFLGHCFFTRFQRLGRLNDLDDAISRQKEAVRLTLDGHPDKPGRLNNLGCSVQARFQRLGQLNDLEDAVSRGKQAVDLTPDGHPNKPRCLNNLGMGLLTRFVRLGQLNDLEDAISRQRQAVDLIPDGHPDKPRYLSNLSNSLLTRFGRLGQLNDLEDTISRWRQAFDLTPNDHPDKLSCLNNLGISFLARFKRLGQLNDLEDAISRLREAIRLTLDGHPDKPGCLNNLGCSFLARFERLGQLKDLEDAISRQREAVDLTPDGHPDKPARLGGLGSSFLTRFERLGHLSDLDDAISRRRQAFDLIPDGHFDKPICLHNLGNSFLTRFKRLSQLSDLEDAISRLREVVDLTPDGHPDKPSRLNSLGNSFLTRFERFGQLNDLEEAILRQGEAVDLTPDGHPDKPCSLNDLGSSFLTRFKRLGQLNDLEDAILRQKEAVDLTPDGHPDKLNCLNNLGVSFLARFRCLGHPSDMEQAISLFFRVASDLLGHPRDRLRASQSWIRCARAIRRPSLLHAYSVSINILPQLAWNGLSLSARYTELTRGADVVREAAAAAIESGLPEIAVEWLEQARSIVWGDLFQLRSSYEDLSFSYPDRAHRLRELSAALECASASHEKSLSALSEPTPSATRSLQQEVDRHRALAIERDELLRDVRKLPGFERFLLQKDFSELRASAHSGPVVMLNAAESHCDALIVLSNVDHVIQVPLPNFTFQQAIDLQNNLQHILHRARKAKIASSHGVIWEPFLSSLWKSVVKPILDALGFSVRDEMPFEFKSHLIYLEQTPGDFSRIFWCPTGPFTFLPIHAAGLYDTMSPQPGDKVFDFVVSSYTPSLSILAHLANHSTVISRELRLLAVRQPPSDGLPLLQGVATELEYMKEVIKNSSCNTLLESSVGTVEEVLELMREVDWVHFACHGIQDPTSPTNSGLCLANERRLKISDIITLSRSRGGLAFLSACQTATGDKELSDEAIHIAAGMLFAGYSGVIGTMWSISDRLAPDVARDVYKELFRDDKRPDCREAARALHEAIKRARDRGERFADWVPFIHVGI